jgi:TonB family protein
VAEARRAGAEGVTVITYVVDEQGLVTDAKITKASGKSRAHEMLDTSALRAVKSGRFRESVGYVRGNIEFEWRLTD